MSAEKLQLEVKILSRCSTNSKVDSREKGKFSCEGKNRAVFSAHHLFINFIIFFVSQVKLTILISIRTVSSIILVPCTTSKV